MASYEKHPVVRISPDAGDCSLGWLEVLTRLQQHIPGKGTFVVAVELYPGVDARAVAEQLRGVGKILLTEDAFLSPEQLRTCFSETLTDDPVFNVMRPATIESYFASERLAELRQLVKQNDRILFVVGPGAGYVVSRPDLLLSANVTRWELQRRQRSRLVGNLGLNNLDASPAELYKIAFFLDWRIGDEIRHRLYRDISYFLDLNDEGMPRMIDGECLRNAVRTTVQQPFRVVPFFDPGPWGGQWMRDRFGLPEGVQNYAWGFDCVPEENSVLLSFGDRRFELPAIVLVHEEPEQLLGNSILHRFGREFPIRFDFLDTVKGGNLSLQVHPSTEYIREHFGMKYTQDESYYMLHADPGSSIYLGLRDQVDPLVMTAALQAAQSGDAPFAADRFVASWPTHTHDHFSIPAGTVHCSGVGNVVLEISATPYIFTFKLWDWKRTGLDGHPRPIHLEHGLANIRWERDASWVKDELIDQIIVVASGDGWTEERTGLHNTEFLETRRHWFVVPVLHDTKGTLNVINLVEGEEVVISSPTHAFPDVHMHYAETVILPACLGEYTISPINPEGKAFATLKAYVRPASPKPE